MLYKSLKDTKLKITPTCFGSYVIHHQGVQSCAWLELLVVVHRYFVVCLVGVWQRNFEPVVFVYGTAGPAGRTIVSATNIYTHVAEKILASLVQELYNSLTITTQMTHKVKDTMKLIYIVTECSNLSI
jgi:hypothetical protein